MAVLMPFGRVFDVLHAATRWKVNQKTIDKKPWVSVLGFKCLEKAKESMFFVEGFLQLRFATVGWLEKVPKTILPNGGLMAMNPRVESQMVV